MARTKKIRFLTILGTLAAAGAMLVSGIAPASAASTVTPSAHTSHDKSINYVNLGDSYSAGFGSGTLAPATIPNCLRGTGPTHVSKIDALKNITLSLDASCAGATTKDIAEIVGAIKPQLATADLVTLTLGANDLDTRGLVMACSTLGSDAACNRALIAGIMAIPAVGASANKTLRALDAATPGKILVLGYPRLFSTTNGNQPLITAKRAKQLNALDDMLNLAIRRATVRTSARFIPVTGAFLRHGLGSVAPWIYFNAVNVTDPFNLHPTPTGYLEGYYPAVKRQLRHLRIIR
ncbi:SGNH/GDSL hydrolase family protein [Arthrobacter sp. MYb227]|uniref:SGNH/GDSL hydrolase family protein n=1 Tax=Arthrobacter sp. MYb227 TaxID=1848601 RepID=UPI0015E3E1DC|nr:SGNH/GDSL hydrolase family protein [Arthrobacter sp. MYb227]